MQLKHRQGPFPPRVCRAAAAMVVLILLSACSSARPAIRQSSLVAARPCPAALHQQGIDLSRPDPVQRSAATAFSVRICTYRSQSLAGSRIVTGAKAQHIYALIQRLPVRIPTAGFKGCLLDKNVDALLLFYSHGEETSSLVQLTGCLSVMTRKDVRSGSNVDGQMLRHELVA